MKNKQIALGTTKEVADRIANGMRRLTLADLKRELGDLGYKIQSSFSYSNTFNVNKFPFYARSCYIVQQDNGLSFANTKARRDYKFETLQKMRFNTFALYNGRIWDI